MADNYLEKRMADHQRGLAPGAAQRHSGHRAGFASVQYPPITAYVRDADLPGGAEVVENFVQAGMKVVLTCASTPAGRALSQRCGGRFYPGGPAQMLADMASRGETIDVEILCSPSPGGLQQQPLAPRRLIIAQTAASLPAQPPYPAIVGADSRQAARIALMAAHPAAAMPPQLIFV